MTRREPQWPEPRPDPDPEPSHDPELSRHQLRQLQARLTDDDA